MITLFYISSAFVIISAIMAISSSNTVHSVLWLILTFCSGADLILTMGAEYISMILIIVYVGAIAVLFLFTVMTLNISIIDTKSMNKSSKLFIITVASIFFFNLLTILLMNFGVFKITDVAALPVRLTNLDVISAVLYTDFVVPFELVGLVLFVTFVGAIMLTISFKKSSLKSQNVSFQMMRNKNNSIILKNVEFHHGIDKLDRDS